MGLPGWRKTEQPKRRLTDRVKEDIRVVGVTEDAQEREDRDGSSAVLTPNGNSRKKET